MLDEPASITEPEVHRPRIQYRLRTLFGLTAGVAIVCSVVFALPNWAAVPILLAAFITFPAVLTTGLVYGRGYQRTFCLGALFPVGMAFLLTTPLFGNYVWFASLDGTGQGNEVLIFRIAIVVVFVLSLVVGMLCVATRRILEKQQSGQSMRDSHQ
jgi:hypothetical protein